MYPTATRYPGPAKASALRHHAPVLTGTVRDADAAAPARRRREVDRAVARPSVAPAPEGMLEAQVQQHRVVTRARPDADRERDARHDLQATGKVVRPADPGTDRQGVARSGAAGTGHRRFPRPHHF